jgi:ubiquitin-conjugating enzyme E2 Q
MVDLLVSLAYVAAAEQVLDEPLPRGLSLKVPDPVHNDPMRDFDSLAVSEMRAAVVQLIDTLPPVRMSQFISDVNAQVNAGSRHEETS